MKPLNTLSLVLTALPLAANAASTPRTIETDVVVVGGGLSGLTSAYELHKAGINTVVLEARDALGGKSRSKDLGGGKIIELGATWINNKTQEHVYNLTRLFGLETAVQYLAGDPVFQGSDGRVIRLNETSLGNTDDPDAEHLEVAALQDIHFASLDVDLLDFNAFPAEQDVTVTEWLAEQPFGQHPHVVDMVTHLSTALVGRGPEEVGMHYFLDYIGSGYGVFSLATDGPEGAQYLKVKNGTTSIVTSLAATLPADRIHLSSPVVSIDITKCKAGVVVTTKSGQRFHAKRVILAIPTNMYKDVTFTPSLPARKQTLTSNIKSGIYAKMILSYRSAWWREAKFAGKFTSRAESGPICFSWDTSDPALDQYSLAVFIAGAKATAWHALADDEAKVAAVVEHLVELVGGDGPEAEAARDTLDVNFVEWTKEDWLEGAPTGSMGPGLLREYGDALRESFGPLHFGGGETAFKWKGYLEGAVLAGKRVAKEVREAL
ncbi:hypothetical protein PspLS_08801 [Pyricularia sp. CBS 133598]|nr:hypothetical protein PspLS_08801 [Pyricularia sp. CBS 133598]